MPDKHLSFREICVCILVAFLVASAIAGRLSIITLPIRLLLISTFVFTIFTVLLYSNRLFATYPRLLYPAFFLLALFVTWTVLGNKPYDVEMLRAAYFGRLASFNNHPYIKYGEAHNGVDSSGLARAALWQAMLKDGIREVNPRLLGPMLWKFWWRDMSVRDIKDGKYKYTKVVGHVSKLTGYNSSKSQIGDMAIVGNKHILIYLGDERWIEANPEKKKVIISELAEHSKYEWLNKPATFVRWWALDQ